MGFTKMSDIKELTREEIENRITELKIEILQSKIRRSTRQNIKPHTFKHQKHELAQLLTAKTQKIYI